MDNMNYKNIFKILYGVTVLFVTVSCNDFLEEKSQDLYIPKTVDDYREFIAGEALQHGHSNGVVLGEYLDVLTDDVAEKVNPRRKNTVDSRETTWGYYSWQLDPEVDFNNTVQADKMWDVCYHRILIANITLDQMSKITGDANKKKVLEAEVRFIRAWSYFNLVNTYAQPFMSKEQANTTPGVPINTATSVQNRQLEKSTLLEVYDVMERDLEKAAYLFEEAHIQSTIFRPNLNATLLLLSRITLYTKQYEKAIKWANKLISQGTVQLYDLSNYQDKSTQRFVDGANEEIIFSYGSEKAYKLSTIISARNTTKGCYIVSPELLKMYEPNDKRRNVFFYPKAGLIVKPYKYYEYGSKNIYPCIFHLSEAYLNRAEAYVEMGQTEKAVDDLNTLRAKRIKGYKRETIHDNKEAFHQIRNERRKELCFEGHRWYDLRRWGCPELRHVYSSSDVASERKEYVLKQNDSRYTLPIPRAERNMNYNLK